MIRLSLMFGASSLISGEHFWIRCRGNVGWIRLLVGFTENDQVEDGKSQHLEHLLNG